MLKSYIFNEPIEVEAARLPPLGPAAMFMVSLDYFIINHAKTSFIFLLSLCLYMFLLSLCFTDILIIPILQQGTKRMPGTAVTKSVVANEPGGRKREEIFVDIIEKISVTFSSSVSIRVMYFISTL